MSGPPDRVAADRVRPAELVILALVGGLTFAAGLGLRDPWPPDEPRFALIARDMVESGRWLFPRVGGELYADKPPLFMWLQAAAYAASGSLRFGFLLPSVLSATGVLLFTYALGCRLWNRRTGLAAAAVLLTLVQFQIQAHSAQIDATLALFTTLALYGFCRHLLEGPDWPAWWGGCAAAGLGVITKGVGILPLLVLLPWAWGVRRGWPVTPVSPQPRSGWRWLAGVGCLLTAIGLWFAPMVVASLGDPALAAYRDEILFRQTAGRYADPWGHLRPPWYFLVSVIPWAWLPVTAFLPWLVPRWRAALAARDARMLLLGGWLLAVIAFFSLSAGKRGVYLLPATPALALLVAPWAEDLARRRGVQRAAFALSALFTLAIAWLAAAPPRRLAEAVARGELAMPLALAAALAVAGLACMAAFRLRRAVAGLLVLSLLAWNLVGWIGAPLLDPVRSGRRIAERLEAALQPGEELALAHWKEQFLLYLHAPLVHFGHRRPRDEALADAAAWLAAGAGRVVLVNGDRAGCVDAGLARFLGHAHRNDWYLVDRHALSPDCGDGRSAPAQLFEYRRPIGEPAAVRPGPPSAGAPSP